MLGRLLSGAGAIHAGSKLVRYGLDMRQRASKGRIRSTPVAGVQAKTRGKLANIPNAFSKHTLSGQKRRSQLAKKIMLNRKPVLTPTPAAKAQMKRATVARTHAITRRGMGGFTLAKKTQ